MSKTKIDELNYWMNLLTARLLQTPSRHTELELKIGKIQHNIATLNLSEYNVTTSLEECISDQAAKLGAQMSFVKEKGSALLGEERKALAHLNQSKYTGATESEILLNLANHFENEQKKLLGSKEIITSKYARNEFLLKLLDNQKELIDTLIDALPLGTLRSLKDDESKIIRICDAFSSASRAPQMYFLDFLRTAWEFNIARSADLNEELNLLLNLKEEQYTIDQSPDRS